MEYSIPPYIYLASAIYVPVLQLEKCGQQRERWPHWGTLKTKTLSAQRCTHSGRKNRRIASKPTEVERTSVAAGYGPP